LSKFTSVPIMHTTLNWRYRMKISWLEREEKERREMKKRGKGEEKEKGREMSDLEVRRNRSEIR
jgi:hypothetical protein